VTPTILPVSRLEVKLCKPRASLSQVDLPGRALVVQHSGRHEVIQGSLLWVARLGFGWGCQKKKGRDDYRTQTKRSGACGQDCRLAGWCPETALVAACPQTCLLGMQPILSYRTFPTEGPVLEAECGCAL
jgi:hypothetical protein